MKKKTFIACAASLGATALLGAGIVGAINYMDLPGPTSKVEAGRTKNAIATTVAGLVGQKMYGNSSIDLEVKKHLWPDSEVTGKTTYGDIDTYMDLNLTSVHFTGEEGNDGYFKGDVDKSEIDWKVKENPDGTYDFNRWGPKFDSNLELEVKDGNIKGVYKRFGPHFDWYIDGTYDDKGNVEFEIDGHLNLGVTLEGKITNDN